MGRVVDSELRVLGVGSLRVIDGSVFSNSNQSTGYCFDAWKVNFVINFKHCWGESESEFD